jgi:membrane-bound ClpP family serine protease
MKKSDTSKFDFALGKKNYILLAIGFVIIVLGFVLMIEPGSDDPTVFRESVYGFRQITLAPMVVLAGFIFEIYAIMAKNNDNNQNEEDK